MKWHFEQQLQRTANDPNSTTRDDHVSRPAQDACTNAKASAATPMSNTVNSIATNHGMPSTVHESLDASPVQRLLLLITDVCLAGTVLVLPFVMGGRQPHGHLLLCGLASVMAVAWSLHQFVDRQPSYRWSGAEPVVLAGLGLVTLQVIALPLEWRERISPNIKQLIPMWNSEQREILGLPEWTTLSFTPHETTGSLIVLTAGVLVLFVALQRIRTFDEMRRVLTWCAWSTLVMAAFGIAQYLLGNGKFFWFYVHPMTHTSGCAKGGFTNANHFANFIAMGIPIWIWRLTSSKDDPENESSGTRRRKKRNEWEQPSAGALLLQGIQSLVAVAALGVIAVGLLLSQSRGGLLFGGIGGMLSMLLLWKQERMAPRTAFTLFCAGAAVIGATTVFGEAISNGLEANFHQIASGDVNQLDEGQVRRQLWESAMLGNADFPLIGTGISSHSEVYWHYYDRPQTGVEASHAESGYFQIALEGGVTGIAIVAMAILLAGWWCVRGLRRHWKSREGAVAAIATSVILINLLHSISDFVWYAPGCMAVVIVCAACARSVASLSRSTEADRGRNSMASLLISGPVRLGWGAFAAVAVVFALWSLPFKSAQAIAEQHWFAFLRIEQANIPADDDAGREAQLLAETKHLLATVQADPQDHRAQYRLAQRCLSLFHMKQMASESPFPLVHFRDATMSMSAEDRDEWLRRPAVIGPRMKYLDAAWNCALKSLGQCPLQSRVYLQLLDIGWLHDLEEETEAAILAQAIEARPYDAPVHLRLGMIAWNEQRLDDGLAHFQEAFTRDARYRRPMLESMHRQFPAPFFLENFDLDIEMLSILQALYSDSEDRRGYEQILEHLALASSDAAEGLRGDDAIREWMRVFGCYQELQRDHEADQALRRAFALNPNADSIRQAMAKWEFDHQRFSAAAEHYRWCYRQDPSNQTLRQLAEEAAGLADVNVTPLSVRR